MTNRTESFEPAWSEDTGDAYEPSRLDEPEPEPDYTDTATWIEIRTDEYMNGATLGPATAGMNISTGRTIVTHRRRTPEDAGLEFVKGVPFYPVPLIEPSEMPERKWRDDDWQPGVDAKLLARLGVRSSGSAGRWFRVSNRD